MSIVTVKMSENILVSFLGRFIEPCSHLTAFLMKKGDFSIILFQ